MNEKEEVNNEDDIDSEASTIKCLNEYNNVISYIHQEDLENEENEDDDDNIRNKILSDQYFNSLESVDDNLSTNLYKNKYVIIPFLLSLITGIIFVIIIYSR
jgi:disulfide oxidoreductase YuzD